jgi:hypothetical protein
MTANLTTPAGVPPGFTAHTCVSVRCGTCHTDFGDGDGPGTLHFDTVTDAADTLTEAGWWVTTTGVQCDTCAARQACATHGHVWTAWRDCGCGCHHGEPRIPTHTKPSYSRSCETCGQWEWQEPPERQDQS